MGICVIEIGVIGTACLMRLSVRLKTGSANMARVLGADLRLVILSLRNAVSS